VFRELATRPVALTDYLLGAAQGIAGWLALSRAQNAGAHSGVAEIFGKALLVGSIAGIASLFLMGAIYTKLAARAGTASARTQVIHVLAYGGVPMMASLVVWVLAALLTGEVTFEQDPVTEVDGFVGVILHVQFFIYVMLMLWSVLIQVMGLSEIQGVATRKAFGLWILGQVVGFLALLFLMIVIATLFPNAVTG
jgi:hypothetical protein